MYMNMKLWSQNLFILSFLCFVHIGLGRKWLEVLRLENCKEEKNLSWSIESMRKHDYSRNNRSIEVTIKVEEETKNIWFSIDLSKCKINGSPDTCEYHIKGFKTHNICPKMEEKGQLWSEYMEQMQPNMKCPIKPGFYKSRSSIRDNAFTFVPLPTGLWKLKALMYQDKKLIGCSYVELKVINMPK